MKKSTVKCPECGGDTVLEELKAGTQRQLIRRCDSLKEIHADKPLEACEWWEEVYRNGHSKQNFISSNLPVIGSLPSDEEIAVEADKKVESEFVSPKWAMYVKGFIVGAKWMRALAGQ